MQVVKYLDSNFQPLLSNLESKVGDGADGEVYNLISGNIAKFSIFFPWEGESLDLVKKEKVEIVNRVKSLPDTFVKVINFQHLMDGSRQTVDGSQLFSIYYYEMERLFKISEDEKKVMHSLISHEDSNLKKDFTTQKAKSILNGLSFGLDFDFDKVLSFIKKLQHLETVGIEYLDYHPRNVMKDSGGNFKLIDIDRMSIF